MALFVRREIQSALNSLSDTLSKEELRKLVQRLNTHEHRIAAEWETVVLAALAKVGELSHEKHCGGSTRPDIFFAGPSIEFVADIRAVSDSHIEEKNPVDAFRSEINRVARKFSLTGAGLDLEVEDEEIGPYGDRKQRLLLPPKGSIPAFVKEHVQPFLKRIAANPQCDDFLNVLENKVHFRLHYNSKEKRFAGGHWTHYTVPYSVDDNPLFKALKRKADQLRGCGWAGLKGIIVCDANCTSMEERSSVSGSFGCTKIVQEFFERHRKTVAFVMLINVVENQTTFPRGSRPSIKPNLFWSKYHPNGAFPALTAVLNVMLKNMAKPARTPVNAWHRLAGKNPDVGDSFFGGYTMEKNQIRISARTVLELLSGKLDQKTFMEAHRLLPGEGPNLFLQQLMSGRVFTSTRIERCEGEDDDWMVFEFGDSDPAVTPFRVPE